MASTMLLASRSTRRLLSRPALRLGAPPPPLWNVGRVRHLSPSYKDPYSVLGVSRGASKDEIKAAYLQLAKKWHPDRNPQRRQQAEAKFKEISEAYSSLSSGPGSSRGSHQSRQSHEGFPGAGSAGNMHMNDEELEKAFREFFRDKRSTSISQESTVLRDGRVRTRTTIIMADGTRVVEEEITHPNAAQNDRSHPFASVFGGGRFEGTKTRRHQSEEEQMQAIREAQREIFSFFIKTLISEGAKAIGRAIKDRFTNALGKLGEPFRRRK
ncbi:hypothetical protein AB1Y20_009477 [Prymnesium parvum]|uniref:J domain-containing protein n=1 Tax=Prymnesium parvum TaxID=97485 RepID=A0AB34K413_PRYPA